MDLAAGDPPLGLGHFSVLEVPPLDMVALAAGAGYAAIGLRLHPAFPGSPFYELPLGSAALAEMRRRLEGEGIRVYDIEFVELVPEFRAESLTPVLESSAALGAQRLNACGDDPDRGRLVENFAALCERAAEFGMGVDLECMAWRQIASFPAALEVVEAAARPNGGALVDALHLSRTGGTPADLQGVPAGRLRSAQLCDAVAELPATTEAIIEEARGGRLPPGQGALPLVELLAELPDHTVLSVEVPKYKDASPAVRAKELFEATRALFQSCRRSAKMS